MKQIDTYDGMLMGWVVGEVKHFWTDTETGLIWGEVIPQDDGSFRLRLYDLESEDIWRSWRFVSLQQAKDAGEAVWSSWTNSIVDIEHDREEEATDPK